MFGILSGRSTVLLLKFRHLLFFGTPVPKLNILPPNSANNFQFFPTCSLLLNHISAPPHAHVFIECTSYWISRRWATKIEASENNWLLFQANTQQFPSWTTAEPVSRIFEALPADRRTSSYEASRWEAKEGNSKWDCREYGNFWKQWSGKRRWEW